MTNQKKIKKKIFVKMIGIIASITTIIGTIYTIIQRNDNINIEGDNRGVVINGDGNTINQNNIEDLSNDEIKRRAQKFYDEGNYHEVIKLYLLDNVQEDPIILNNLGYMYAKGIGTDKNIEKAYKYLKENVNINLNEEYVLPNYVIFLLNSKNKTYIKEGIWIISHKEFKEMFALDDFEYLNISYSLKDKVEISDKKYNSFINKYYIDIAYYELLDTSIPITKNEFINYQLIDSHYENKENSCKLINKFLVSEKLFSIDNKSVLDISFIDS